MGRIAGRFARVEPRRRAGRLVLGLLAELPRKNCWTIAEWAGDASPHGMQHLLCRAAWDADAVRDDVREYVVEHLGDEAAVLVVDETGDVLSPVCACCFVAWALSSVGAEVVSSWACCAGGCAWWRW